MASHAVGDGADAFLGVFGSDLSGLVFVAAITRVPAGIPARVVGGTRRLMRTGEREITIMVKPRRFPCRCGVAGGAFFSSIGVEFGLGGGVARAALPAHIGAEQRVGKALLGRLDQFGAAMVGVAIDARRLGQRLVEGDGAVLFDNRHALGRAQTYIDVQKGMGASGCRCYRPTDLVSALAKQIWPRRMNGFARKTVGRTVYSRRSGTY